MNEITITAQTIEAAVQEALDALEVERNQTNVEIIEPGKKGFLGIFKGKPAVVKVTKIVDPVEEAVHFITNVSRKMGISIHTNVKKTSRNCIIEISSDSAGMLIGKHGQTLNALQLLTQLVANRYSQQFLNVVLNPEGYREKRKEMVEKLALKIANQAIKTNRSVQLEPMPSHERKMIHQVLAKNSLVETHSIGKEPKRSILVQPVGKKH